MNVIKSRKNIKVVSNPQNVRKSSLKRKKVIMTPKRKNTTKLNTPKKNKKGDNTLIITPGLLNYYKKDSTPIFENKYLHPGTYEFSERALKFLKKKYKNFISSHKIRLTFTNDDNENFMGFSFYNGNVDRQYDDFTRINYYDGERIIDKNTDTIIKNILKSDIKKCVKEKKRFYVIPIAIHNNDYEYGHANILIFDIVKNTIERFDPHGLKTMDIFNPEEIDKMIKDIFNDLPRSTINKPIKYLKTQDININLGLQAYGERKYLLEDEIKGYCGAWSFLYIQSRISNPDMPQKTLVKLLIEQINKKGNQINMIRNYVKYILNEGYRHNYEIEPKKLFDEEEDDEPKKKLFAKKKLFDDDDEEDTTVSRKLF